ncbi:hypothetical protein GTO27_05595 [Candidatus Bathyarchaeota archaeon]|nr:hypothetical protein [Candidatus Bathyarchaeota archaeon]
MGKKRFKILDTFPDFLAYWTQARSKSVNEQIRAWQKSYMGKYPELMDKQIKSYEKENEDWLRIAEKILPSLPDRVHLMRKARGNILSACELIYEKASMTLELDFQILFLIYVGIGCGAGWATTYEGKPAILLGLENIAERRWHTKKKLKGLISHEIGHLAHMTWRNEWETFEDKEQDPLFQLYSEGFAQKCEHLILGRETWHIGQDKGWLSWCSERESWLAGEYLKRVEEKQPVNDFYGSWFSIQGRTHTGYFLGHAFVSELEKTRSLMEIALLDLDEVRKHTVQFLNIIAGRSTKQ